MSSKTCFVVMAIGDQPQSGGGVSAAELKAKYDDLIKEAINRARPSVEVVRSDEVSMAGTITTDIVTRLMHSDYVIADVTFPNPNVFYELGLRHACRPGTIIIKDRSGPKIPFDIAHLRYIEYDNTPTGLKSLSSQLGSYFDHIDKQPSRPDNHFLELAKLTSYEFPKYTKEEVPLELQVMMGIMESPDLMELLLRQQAGEDVPQHKMVETVLKSPKVAEAMFKGLIQSGEISFLPKP